MASSSHGLCQSPCFDLACLESLVKLSTICGIGISIGQYQHFLASELVKYVTQVPILLLLYYTYY